MDIKRIKLLNDLHKFVSIGNGLITGKPGVGKTYLLNKLRQNFKSAGIVHLLLRIDQLGEGNNDTLRQELSLDIDLIDKLKTIQVSGKKALLLLDAFDAARNDKIRNNFLLLIRRAIQELPQWNVMVSVRTYDAKKSKELLNLFGGRFDEDLSDYQSKDILCRHFTIPPFSEDEILQALDQIGYHERVYRNGSTEFKDILSNPFNLWLLEKIYKFSPDKDLTSISQIRSEVQLLERFWNQRIPIEDDTRKFVLHKVTDQMLIKRAMTVKVYDIHEDVDLDKQERKEAWETLQSDEILSRVSSNDERIAFSHHILFDYAISVLKIDDDPNELETFLSQDPARALFLRPSLTYFFTRLWYYDPTSFWKVLWYILSHDQSVHLRLVARLIAPGVIANEASVIEQLNPLYDDLQNADDLTNNAIMWLLQSIQTLQIENDTLWTAFFDRISEYLHDSFASELAKITSDILDRAIQSKNASLIQTCGLVGRRLLEWVLQKTETDNSDRYNGLGTLWVLPLVTKTYHTNIEESRVLLNKVLELTKEEKLDIGFLAQVTENIDSIWDHDPDFVALIYQTVFGHHEISNDMVSTSFRSQDYKGCQYMLIEHFPDFHKTHPLIATSAGIQSLNVFILLDNVIPFLREKVSLKEIGKLFNFRNRDAYFVEDGSYIWNEQKSTDEPIEMAETIFEYMAELSRSEESIPLLDSLLDIFRDNVVVAFFWKRLLLLGSQFPKVFASRLFELCIAKPIQLHPECFYELGLFLKSASSEFTPTQLLQIEESILAYPIDISDDSDQRILLERQRNRLIAQIPTELLQDDRTKKIRGEMEKENDIPENRPLVSFSTEWESVPEEKLLQQQGIDTNNLENQKLLRISNPITQFNSEWRNKSLTKDSAELVLPQLHEAYTAIYNSQAEIEAINSLFNKIAECSTILGRIADKLENESYLFCRKLLLEAADHKEPIPIPDDKFDFPGYSSLPRHFGTEGLLRVAKHIPDAEILTAIEKLAEDPVPSVRMVVAMHLPNVCVKDSDRFWHIIENRANCERNAIVQECLYSALANVIQPTKEYEDKTARAMKKMLKHTPVPQLKLGPFDAFSHLLIGLAIVRKNQWALNTIYDTYLKDPIKFSNILIRIVSRAIKDYINPEHKHIKENKGYLERIFILLSSIISTTTSAIIELGSKIRENRTEDVEEELRNTYSIINEIITRLYFMIAYQKNSNSQNTEKESYKGNLSLIYNEVKPLMEQVIDFAVNKENGQMFAPTAHYFIKLLKSFLNCNPKEVLHLVEGVTKSSETFGYTLDGLVVREIVQLVEIVLTDYQHVVRDDDECMESLLKLLDLFAKSGWSEAQKLVWRLDEVFR